jgi:hypothetical protein
MQAYTGEQYHQHLPQSLHASPENQPVQLKSQTTSSSPGPTGGAESPLKSRPSVANAILPSIPSKPQVIGSNGMYGNISLGKLSTFLEQMKSEVEDTDRMIKHLQTDTKIMVRLHELSFKTTTHGTSCSFIFVFSVTRIRSWKPRIVNWSVS